MDVAHEGFLALEKLLKDGLILMRFNKNDFCNHMCMHRTLKSVLLINNYLMIDPVPYDKHPMYVDGFFSNHIFLIKFFTSSVNNNCICI